MIEKGDVQSAVDALRLEAIGWVHMCGESGNLLHVPCLTTVLATHIAQANNILVSGLPSCAHSLRYNTYTASSSSSSSSFPSSSPVPQPSSLHHQSLDTTNKGVLLSPSNMLTLWKSYSMKRH